MESTSEDNEPNNKASIKTDIRAANNLMSVSVPNLTSNMDTVSLLESFAAVARRNLSANTNNMVRSSNASNFMRMALSANTNVNTLSVAQSFPTLSSSGSTSTKHSLKSTQTMSNVTMGVSSLGQALTASLGYVPGSDSDNELLGSCLANTLQLDHDDDDDIEVDDDDDDDNEDDDNEQFDEPEEEDEYDSALSSSMMGYNRRSWDDNSLLSFRRLILDLVEPMSIKLKSLFSVNSQLPHKPPVLLRL